MQRGILEQMKEAEPIHKKHYMQSSKDKSVSAGMVFKKNSIGKSFAILSEAPQRSNKFRGDDKTPHLPKTEKPERLTKRPGFIILATTYSRTTAGSYYHRRLRA